MPYIRQDDREHFEAFDNVLLNTRITSAGELNYLITLLMHAYLHQNGWNYAHMNDVIGAIESAKLELYRRKIAPYEDKKIDENGDV